MRTQQALAVNKVPAPALASAIASIDCDEPLRVTGTVVNIPEGQEICAEGDSTDVFYKVLSGVVRVCKFLHDGRRQIEAFHVSNEMFGLEVGGERLFSAEAVSDCSIIAYRRRSVEQQARRDQAIGQQLIQHAMQGLMQAQAHSLLLGRRGAAEKVASFLLDWSAKAPQKGSLHLVMSRQDMADFLSLTIETVSRSMSQFERDGVIALSGSRHVHILKRPRGAGGLKSALPVRLATDATTCSPHSGSCWLTNANGAAFAIPLVQPFFDNGRFPLPIDLAQRRADESLLL